MFTNLERQVAELNFFDKLFAQVSPASPKSRTHNFTKQIKSVNYEFEELDARRGQMTGCGKGINPRDFILLTEERIRYRVEAIDYYSDPANLWTALLFRCSAE
ncbi:MAG: hypothetical protein U7127_02075 [Phormidium sp.]